MQTVEYASRTGPPTTFWHALGLILLPGPLDRRARAAASLPSWLAGLFVVLALPVGMELFTYSVEVLDRGLRTAIRDPMPYQHQPLLAAAGMSAEIAWREFEVNILHEFTRMNAEGLTFVLAMLVGFTLAGLQVIHFLVVAPFGVPFGVPLHKHERRTRNLLFSLGTWWLLQALVAWAGLSVLLNVGVIWLGMTARNRVLTEIASISIGVGIALLLVLAWLLRLIRAASTLATVPDLALRCGHCGYFLEGLADEALCPECGQDPVAIERAREPSEWVQRSQVGYLRGLFRPAAEVLLAPSHLFRRIEVLTHRHHARRYLVAALGLCGLAGMLSAPGIVLGIGGPWRPVKVEDICIAVLLAIPTTIGAMLSVLVLVGLQILLIGWQSSRARQEPAWPIAAAAGCYLAGFYPWLIAAEAVWATLFLGMEWCLPVFRWRTICRELARPFRADWELIYFPLLILLLLIGLPFAFRAAVVCYRNVRYTCR